MFTAQYGVAKKFNFVLIDPATGQYMTSATISQANDTRVIQDGVDGGSCDNAPSYVAGGVWELELSAAEMQAKHIMVTIRDATDPATYYDQAFEVETIGNASAAVPVVIDATTGAFYADLRTIKGAVQSVTDLKHFADSGYEPGTGFILGVTNTLNCDVTKIGGSVQSLADFKDLVDVGYDPATNTLYAIQTVQSLGASAQGQVNAEVDTALNTAIPGSPTADSVNERLQALDDKAEAVVSGAFAGTPSTTTGETNLSGYAADVFIDRYIYITSGTYQGEFAKITDYVVADGVLTYEELSGAPSATDTFVIA